MAINKNNQNRQTWERVIAGDVTAYRQVVESHQSAVSAVAYSIVGDFPISQDIAQETFWVAWNKRNSLRDVGKLGSWLCGIARNIARQWRSKQKGRASRAEVSLQYDPVADMAEPVQQSIADEEQRVVWNALEQIPENYREVLTLYYRQGQSVAEVAASIDITEETARQRLSRGRNMLRGRVSRLIEGVLDRSKPDRSFAGKVIAGLAGAGISASAGTASAASIGTAAKTSGALTGVMAKGALASGASTGLLGGMLGAIGGLAGGFLGTWIPAQLAPTETERQMLLQQGRVVLGLTIVLTVAVTALTLVFVFARFEPLYFFVALLALTLAFVIPITIQAVKMSRLIQELRKQLSPESDPNQSRFAKYARQAGVATVRKGRSYRSELEFFGYPLVDIQFSDADFSGNPVDKSKRRHARGWIALGDRATGILFAAGGMAKGFIAVGGMTFGAISLGGMSIGVISLGGMSLGLVAVGGVALGWDVAGGLAVGWHSAAGGMAVSWHAAMGGLAVASEYAVGGAAYAKEANTELAETVVKRDSLQSAVDWIVRNQTAFVVGMVAISLLPAVMMKWVYRQAPPEKGDSSKDNRSKQ